MKHTKLLLVPIVLGSVACGGSEYTIVDRSALVVSENARVSATSLLPGGARNPRLTNHLALAQEVYQKRLDLLKERRNKVRARRRTLNLASFGVLAASSLAVGSAALYASARDSNDGLTPVGSASLGGLAVGTAFQIGALMQEDSSAVDDKIRHLQQIFDAMLDRVRTLALQPASEGNEAQMGAAIEAFVNAALQINVKG